MKILNELLNESSLSRLYNFTRKHDFGTITAFRDARECGEGTPYTYKENMKRNAMLFSLLRAKQYSITSIRGSYIENYGSENAKEVSENSFIVIDINDRGDLKETLMSLGEKFEQDSIIFGKAGEKGILIGTSECPHAYPGYHIEEPQGGAIFGQSGEFMSRVRGRPFVFTESIHEHGFIKYPTSIKSAIFTARKLEKELEEGI
jgi:hypothetical protein